MREYKMTRKFFCFHSSGRCRIYQLKSEQNQKREHWRTCVLSPTFAKQNVLIITKKKEKKNRIST